MEGLFKLTAIGIVAGLAVAAANQAGVTNMPTPDDAVPSYSMEPSRPAGLTFAQTRRGFEP